MSETPKKPKNPETARDAAFSRKVDALKADLVSAPVFAFLEKFDSFVKKRTRSLASGETLFEPGEDPNFYVVVSGALKISRVNPSGEKKEIGKAYAGSFLGEGILSGRNLKEVEAVAYVPTSVTCLTKDDFDRLELQSPETLMRLYRHLNDRTSLRLAETGKELALLYEATEKIESYRERGERGFVDAVDLLRDSLGLDYVVVVEQHPAVPDMFVYKYNTKFPSVYPVNQRVGREITPDMPFGPVAEPSGLLGVFEGDSAYALAVRSGQELRGVFILGKRVADYVFRDHEIRIAEHLAPLFASMIEGNHRIADERARAMMAGR